MVKNAFYFTQKAPFVLRVFKFLSWGLGHAEKMAWFSRTIKLISKFMTSQPGYQTVTMHGLLNISRSKGIQIIKFGQLTKY